MQESSAVASRGAADASVDKVAGHEEAAHEKRNWVRLTFDCNDRCVFCLDSHTHDGTNRNRQEVKDQILDGRRKGAQRLILSGGEPTIHPDYIKFIELGRRAGYRKVQTVTNGRMFAYRQFLTRCIDAGLNEITFSIHGPNAKVHDALVGTKGAFEQEVTGLQHALDDGRVIVNIDVCVNKGNVKVLPDILAKFTAMGVKEYDLLHVIPFGRAYTEGKETLFYDLEEMRPHLLEAFAYSKRPDMHIWLNRFPVQHLEGYEHLIQDPYKLGDEVRGRKEEYAQLLDKGIALDCRAPDRCRHCYLEPLCDRLDEVRSTVSSRDFEIVRIDTTVEATLPEVYGGDPASKKRSESYAQVLAEAEASGADARKRLPILNSAQPVEYPPLAEQAIAADASALWVVGPDLGAIDEAIALTPSLEQLELELEDYAGLADRLEGNVLDGRTIVRAVARSVEQAQQLLAVGTFDVVVDITRKTAPWLLGNPDSGSRLVLRQPTWDRLTESAQHDVNLRDFFEQLAQDTPVEDVPRCIAGDRVRSRPQVLDAAMMTPEGRLEIFRYARRYIRSEYWSKSLRCSDCIHAGSCRGLHINYIRAHGFAALQPVLADVPE